MERLLAAAVGPLTYGLVTWLTDGNQRLAMLLTSLFFIAALAILYRVDLNRGQVQRHTSDQPG